MELSVVVLVVVLVLAISGANAFSISNRRSFVRLPRAKSLTMISFPLFTSGAPVVTDAPKATDRSIGIVKSFVSSNFGLIDDSLLANDCVVSGPTVYFTDKQKYLTAFAKEQSAFLRAVPDYDVRAYSFAIDKYDDRKIWFKLRPRGTITGPYSYNGEVYLPNQKNIEFPIQQMSVTINNNGLISKITTGYVIDKFVGNTNGLVGRDGLLSALDNIPNKFTYLPPAIVLKQFFSRNRKPQARNSRISPFPFAVMESLANAVLNSNFGAKNPSLLDNNFLFSTPFDGPYNKNEFLSNVINQYNFNEAFQNFDYNAYNIEVDQYDPERVWLIIKSSGILKKDITRNGKVIVPASNQKLDVSPEAISMSFNEEGLCYKVSAGYVLDKLDGNSNGLGGYRGIIESVSGSIPVWEKTSYNDLIFRFNQAINGAFPSKPKNSAISNVESANDKPQQNNQPVLKVDTPNVKTKPQASTIRPQASVSKSEISNVVSKPKIPVDNRLATTPKPEVKKTESNNTKPTLDNFFVGNADGILTSKSVTEKKVSAVKTNVPVTKSTPAVVTKAGSTSVFRASSSQPKPSNIATTNKSASGSLLGNNSGKVMKTTSTTEKSLPRETQQSVTKTNSAPIPTVKNPAIAPKTVNTVTKATIGSVVPKQESVYTGSLYSSRLTAKSQSIVVTTEKKQIIDNAVTNKAPSQQNTQAVAKVGETKRSDNKV